MSKLEEVIIHEEWESIQCDNLDDFNNAIDEFTIKCEEFKEASQGRFNYTINDNPEDLTISITLEYAAYIPVRGDINDYTEDNARLN